MAILPSPRPLRIALRPALPADAPLLFRWRGEPTVRLHQPLAEASLAELRTDLARQRTEELYRGRGDRFQWIVLAEGDPVGWVTLAIANWDHGIAEVGYALTTAWQGRGVMPVALGQLLAELFAETPLARIEARCSVENVPSQRVLERVGFVREGLLRSYFLLGDRRIDNWLYAVLRRDILSASND
jgi:ribosomal-protein-alanine N-acetyltransferase